jgi:hypothetical protein
MMKPGITSLRGCAVVAALAALSMSACDPSAPEPARSDESRAVSGECPPLDLDCQNGQLDPAQRAQLTKLENAARNASVTVEGAVVGNRLEIRYYDQGLKRWFHMLVWRYGYQHLLINRYVIGDDGRAVGYYVKSMHPTDPSQVWSWSDYGRAAAAVGRPLTEDLQFQLDAAAGMAFMSDQTLAAFRALKSGGSVPTDVATACAVSCFNDLADVSFTVGVISAVGCAAITRSSAGIACGVVGAAFTWKGLGIEDCHDTCLSCYEKMVDSCKVGGVVPRGCNGAPFRCMDGKPIIVKTF